MKRWVNKRNGIILLVVILLVGWWWMGRKNPDTQELKTAEVKMGDVKQILTASGKIQAEKMATLNFNATGKLAFIRVRVGDGVAAGQVMAGMDIGDLKAAEQAAYYKYIAADANAKEVEDSVKGHDVGESFAQKNDRVAAQTARDIAYDGWLTAQRAVKNSYLVAPFDGIVTGVTAQVPGDTVSITDGITVVDPGSLYFASEIDESDVWLVPVGKVAEIKLDAYPDDGFEGAVFNVAFESSLSSTGATVYKAKISLPSNDLGKYRIGMNGDANLVLKEAKGVLKVPVEAAVDGQVEVKVGEQIVKRAVETGVSSDAEVEIRGEFNVGDVVVVR
jgi:RND family efflux transporter MFP subunit